ncbi:DUF1697 domain-containing protein [Rhodoferax saidenbachensis]|uniref:Uncharacterized protein (DUF1697 family) n=1 Tax=Rhodoferax saidenbachensis TaxID=1484693 RepID=A0ABU1ZRW7_9BURK|nr:DUF1697 domain-containing protein [Rhodoferax saidenbachensis]MDR7308299.1 uncharacterized protein (DUF1697 family) [Rhodoferax saidenbachensis]
MPRYVAFLRGVSPMNAKMPELKRAFEAAGFTNVKTVLSSGNVVFDARNTSEAALERKAEAAMQQALGRSFYTLVRPVSALEQLLQTDPYAAAALPPQAKRVVSFLREAPQAVFRLPVVLEDAQIVSALGREVFSAYVPGDTGPVFMRLIEKTFGSNITTRTWESVKKCAAA